MTAKQSKETMPVAKLAYSYRRYSSTGQRDGSSLERQLEMAVAVCSEKSWTLIDLPPDEGMSGYKGINKIKGALGAFLNKVKAGQIPKGSVIIFEKMDRFSRQDIDLVIPDFLSLLQNGVEIYSCVDRTHYTLADIRRNPMMLNYAVMGMAMANDYSKSLGDRITRSVDIRLAKCSQGLKMDLGPWNPRWVDFSGEHKQPGSFALNKHAATIQRMVREYLAGQSMYSIAKGLIRDDVPTLAGGKWAQGTVGHLLGNATLIGDVKIKGTVLKGYYPPVITTAEYTRLQAKLNENKARRGGSAHSDYVANLFRNRCKCFHCGGTITTIKVSGCNHHLYTCKTKRLGKCKSDWSIRVSDIERDFFLHYLQQAPSELLTKNTAEHSDKVAAVQSEIAEYDAEVAKITELTATLPIAELKTKLTVLENKRQLKKAELDQLNTSMISSQRAPKALLDIKGLIHAIDEALVKRIRDKIERFERENPGCMDEYYEQSKIGESLKDNETRKRLLGLLPSIVKGLVIDTTKKQYAVVSHNGTQSEWRTVAVA